MKAQNMNESKSNLPVVGQHLYDDVLEENTEESKFVSTPFSGSKPGSRPNSQLRRMTKTQDDWTDKHNSPQKQRGEDLKLPQINNINEISVTNDSKLSKDDDNDGPPSANELKNLIQQDSPDFAQSEHNSRNGMLQPNARTLDNTSHKLAGFESQRNFNPRTARNSIQTKTISLDKYNQTQQSK